MNRRMLAMLVLAALGPLHAAGDGVKPAPVQRWYGTFTITVDFSESFQVGVDGATKASHRESFNASGSFELTRDPESTNTFRGEGFDFVASGETEEKTEGPGGSVRMTAGIAGPKDNGNSAFLTVLPDKRLYSFGVHVGRFRVRNRSWENSLCSDPSAAEFCAAMKKRLLGEEHSWEIHARMKDRAINPGSQDLSGSGEFDTQTLDHKGETVRGVMSWTLSTRPLPDEVEVTVTPEDDTAYATSWRPRGNVEAPDRPGNSLRLVLSVHKAGDPSTPRKANLNFSFVEVSKQQGICMNWPAATAAKAKPGLRLRQEDHPAVELEVTDEGHAGTVKPVEKLHLVVQAYDYGAWGTLRVQGRDPGGRTVNVKVRGKAEDILDIPKDDDRNRIADGWEEGKPWKGKGKDWDGEEVPGQDAKGDGITLYDEYRGAVVLAEGRKTWTDLDPGKKEMFVIDDKGSFDGDTWESLTRIKAYRVDEELSRRFKDDEAPVVNFHSPGRDSHAIYGLTVRTIENDLDPDPPTDQDGNTRPSYTTDPRFPVMAYAIQEGTLKSTEYVKVFPGRVWIFVNYWRDWLAKALADSDSEEGKALAASYNWYSVDQAREAFALLKDPGKAKAVSYKILTALTLHEAGHSCGGLADHRKMPPGPYVSLAESCLMFNPDNPMMRRMVYMTALLRASSPLAYPFDRFCRDLPSTDWKDGANYNCFKRLTVKCW